MRKGRESEFEEGLVAEVVADYHIRREERRHFEAQWQLNNNFLIGNQYCSVGISGGLESSQKEFFWQEREVFNHVAFIVESRLAKLNKVRPKLSVRPSSGDDDDQKTAAATTKILQSAGARLGINDILMKGTQWSETAGCVFYKVSWDKTLGRKVGVLDGHAVYEGDVKIDVCPPYEIFPDSITNQDISDCNSIIHARAVHVSEIERLWGVAVEPEALDTVSLSGVGVLGGLGLSSAIATHGRGRQGDHAVVIERYTLPTAEKPRGELVTVAGGRLLYCGELPFACGEDGAVGLPFIKQDSQVHVGCFFGSSIIERAIPVQRAYNAVKNRKHEFLNRISMGVLAVEDGSVDTDNLEAEGLCPGKILLYRQGSTPPALLDCGTVPAEFDTEEEKLLNEFVMISGVSDIMRSSSTPTSTTSGVALQLLLDQDDTRMSATAERIRLAAKAMAHQIIRLYKQFAGQPRLSRCVGEAGEVELIHWRASSMSGDDIVFDTENELSDSLAARRSLMLELIKTGLLNDENGKMSDSMRYKALELLGYGGWEHSRDIQRLQILRAERENTTAIVQPPIVKEIDDHAQHIAEHTRFLLSKQMDKYIKKNPALEQILTAHIRAHKDRLAEEVSTKPVNSAVFDSVALNVTEQATAKGTETISNPTKAGEDKATGKKDKTRTKGE